jgi:hypothetical protein
MSKEKKVKTKIKRKTTALDIVSRVITALAAAAVPVAAYFANMFYVVFESTVFQIIAKIKGDTTDDGSTYDYISIRKIVEEYLPLIKSLTSEEKASNVMSVIEPVKGALICTGVLFAIAIVCAVVIFFISVFTNSNKLPLIFSAVGFISSFCMVFAFRAFSAPFVAGDITLGDFLKNELLGALAPYVASISILNLSTAWITMLVIFAGIFIWHGAQLVVSIGEKTADR